MTCEGEPSEKLPELSLDIEGGDEDPVIFSYSDNQSWSGKTNKSAPDAQSSTSQNDNKSISNPNYQLSDEQKHAKVESKATPRRAHYSNSRAGSKPKQSESPSSKPCEQHTFLTDITEVRQMEQGLLRLLDDFHSGKLQAFGKDCTFEKMEQVREQQERLARLHLELNAQQEIYGPQSDEERRIGRENLGKLIENLQQLSNSIEQLQISSPSVQTEV